MTTLSKLSYAATIIGIVLLVIAAFVIAMNLPLDMMVFFFLFFGIAISITGLGGLVADYLKPSKSNLGKKKNLIQRNAIKR